MSYPVFYSVIYLLCNSLVIYGKYKSMDIFFDKCRTSKKTIIILFMVYLIINSGLYLILGNPLVNLLTNMIMFFLLTFNYISSIYNKLLATAAVYIISMATESIIYYILISFITEQTIDIMTNIVSSILFYFIIILLSNLKNIKTTNKISWIYIFILTMIFICSIYVSIVIADERIKNNNIYTALGIAAVLIINILAVFIYDILNKNYKKELDQQLMEKQNNFYVKQLEMMQQSQNNIKILKHDINNHMITLNSMVDDNIEIKKYINNFINSFDIPDEYSKSGNVIIDSILNYKLQEATEKEIEVELNIKVPPQLNISPFDMSIILGNLLDNAIEAASKLTNDKKIKIDIYFEKGSLYIHITNTFNGIIVMENKKYKTTRQNKESHGLGLLSITNALEKYNGGIDISYKDNLFSIKILLDNVI